MITGKKRIISHPQNNNKARPWWLTPVILATQEAEIRSIMV
jgi:hypothetical protein